MTASQIFSLLRTNGCKVITLTDYGKNKLHEIVEQEPEAAILALENDLPKFAGYRKIQVMAAQNETTPNAKRLCWQLEFPAEDGTVNKTIAAPSQHAGIGVMDYIKLHTEMTERNFALQKELMEKTLAANNQDPAKWLPILQAVGPALGLNVGGIQGPPKAAAAKKELHLGDVGTLTDEQVSEKVGEALALLSTKITGTQMLKIVSALNNIENISGQSEKLVLLLNAIHDRPTLLDQAVKFIS